MISLNHSTKYKMLSLVLFNSEFCKRKFQKTSFKYALSGRLYPLIECLVKITKDRLGSLISFLKRLEAP